MTSGKVIVTTSTLWIASSVDQACLFYFLLPCDTKKKGLFFLISFTQIFLTSI